MNGPDPFWDWLRRLRRPPAPPSGSVTLGQPEAVGYYASPELAQKVDPIQLGMRLAQQQSNVPAMQRSQAILDQQDRSPLSALGHIAANNLVDVVLPGDYSQFDQQAIDRVGDPNADLFPRRVQEMFRAQPGVGGPTRADAYGLAAAGGAVGGNLGLNMAIPNVGNLERGMNAAQIGKALLRGGAVEGLTGGALAFGEAMGAGQTPGEAFRTALPQAGIQAGLGMAFRGLHGRPALREAGLDPNVRDLLPTRESMTRLWDSAEQVMTGGPTGATPHQEYQAYVDAGQVPPRRVREAMDAQDARVNAEEAALGISRPEPELHPSEPATPQQFHDHFFGPQRTGEEGMIGAFGIRSRLPKSIQAAKLEKAPAQTWVSKLRGAGNNASEFDWVVGEVLRRDPKRVWTRQQLLDLANGKGIKISERVLGDSPTETKPTRWVDGGEDAATAIDAQGNQVGSVQVVRDSDGDIDSVIALPTGGRRGDFSSIEDAKRFIENEHHTAIDYGGEPRFNDPKYVLPGGSNYREVLVKLENGDPVQANTDQHAGSHPFRVGDRIFTDEDSARQFAESGRSSGEFQSTHWDDPNVLLHLRLNDRIGPNGEKVLFVEELQSDWMQQGRKEGFQQPMGEPATATRTGWGGWEVRDANGRFITNVSTEATGAPDFTVRHLPTEADAIAEVRRRIAAGETSRLGRESGIPDAPGMFKDTPQWTLLGLKRALDEAVAGGYDRMAWTTGAQQAARYDLSKVVDEVQYDPDTRTLITFGEGGRQHFSDVPPNELEEYIGKEGAERLLASPREREGVESVNIQELAAKIRRSGRSGPQALADYDIAKSDREAVWDAILRYNRGEDAGETIGLSGGGGTHVLRGADLKVGGEGMHGYYDQILPDALKAYGKKLGVRLEVEPANLGAGDAPEQFVVFDKYGHPDDGELGRFNTREEAEDEVRWRVAAAAELERIHPRRIELEDMLPRLDNGDIDYSQNPPMELVEEWERLGRRYDELTDDAGTWDELDIASSRDLPSDGPGIGVQQSIRITPELRSKIQGGQELGQGAPAMMGGMAGGIGGAAYGATQGDTPEERMRNALLYGAAGLTGGVGLGRLAENAPLARLFGEVEAGFPSLPRGEVRGLLDELGKIGVSHGAPHTFAPEPGHPLGRFRLDKIGTGEGAQAYGWGAYLNDHPDNAVANEYRARLAGRPEIRSVTLAGRTVGDHNHFDYSPRGNSNEDNIRSSLFEELLLDEPALAQANNDGRLQEYVLERLDARIVELADEWPEGVPAAKALRKKLAKPGGVAADISGDPGSLYTADIDAEPEHFLDWDKPLSEQSDYVRRRLQLARDGSLDTEIAPAIIGYENRQMTGEELYRAIEAELGPQEASTFLRDIGIPGNRYLDGNSRGKGQGSHNYVVFDDAKLNITGRNGQKLPEQVANLLRP